MKKPVLFIAIVLTAAAAAVFFLVQSRQNTPGTSGEAAGTNGYVNYRGEFPLGVSFDVPKDWRVEPSKGATEPYTQITIKGPRNSADTYRTAFIIRLNPTRTNGGKFDSVDQLKEMRLSHLFKDAKVLNDGKVRVADTPAKDALATWTLPPLLQEGLKGIAVDLKSRMIFFERNGAFYEIQYIADAAEFESYRPHFERLLKSFSFNLK